MFSRLLAFAVIAFEASGALATPTTPPPAVSGMATEFTPGPVATKAPPDAVVQVKSEDLVPSADGVGEIMLCIDSQFRPPCTTALHLESTCTNVPVNFNDNVSAVRPVQGVVCTLYADVNCGGQNILSIYPGYPDLATQGFNDRLTAYICT